MLDNYQTQSAQARRRFLKYDQEALIRRHRLRHDEAYLYIVLLSQPYRISRATGDMERWVDGGWEDGNSFEEVMTVLDWLCDSREDRTITGRWENMQSFGLRFHQNLLEDARNRDAERFDRDLPAFRRACVSLGGEPMAGADAGYAIELLDGLKIWVQLWRGDAEFPPRLRYLWDANATRYIRYETMYYAVALLLSRIRERMGSQQNTGR